MTDVVMELMDGAVDIHFHASPDLHPRVADEIEVARQASALGMRALLSKPHYGLNADRMCYVNDAVPAVRSFGGVSLNHSVGGINPYAVEACIRFGGKEVWMPGLYSGFTLDRMAESDRLSVLPLGVADDKQIVSILDEDGRANSATREVLALVAEANIILGSAHLSPKETYVLIREARTAGVKKVLVTHPLWPPFSYTASVLGELVGMGAVLELCYSWVFHEERGTLPRADHPIGSSAMERVLKTISLFGPQHCVLATDFGHSELVHSPPEGLKIFLETLLRNGVPRQDLEVMVKSKPAALLEV